MGVHSETQMKSQQLRRRPADKSTKMRRNQCKKEENTENQNTSPPRKDQNSSPAREQSWTKNDCDEMTKLDFRRWIMRNFCELKDHVVNQCKETKNLEKKGGWNSTENKQLREDINELMELKNTTENFVNHTQISIAELSKQKKGYQRLKINSVK